MRLRLGSNVPYVPMSAVDGPRYIHTLRSMKWGLVESCMLGMRYIPVRSLCAERPGMLQQNRFCDHACP